MNKNTIGLHEPRPPSNGRRCGNAMPSGGVESLALMESKTRKQEASGEAQVINPSLAQGPGYRLLLPY
ncbi:hypothetical protein CDL15_Pgr016980 [Punica granatum]|uniref:Uncharacterized protein n=1 Tax=Punica granatum TaxID=22663 RepID=A0A218WZT2_PUNGR|nr:hypothetical protein CDL15_Pgr016980 [Punica granatum]